MTSLPSSPHSFPTFRFASADTPPSDQLTNTSFRYQQAQHGFELRTVLDEVSGDTSHLRPRNGTFGFSSVRLRTMQVSIVSSLLLAYFVFLDAPTKSCLPGNGHGHTRRILNPRTKTSESRDEHGAEQDVTRLQERLAPTPCSIFETDNLIFVFWCCQEPSPGRFDIINNA